MQPAKSVDRSDQVAPDAAVKFYVLGRAAWRSNQRREAIDRLEQAHRLDPGSADVLRLLGWVHFDFENESEGSRALKKAMQLEPDDPQSLFLLGRVAFRAGRFDEAVVALSRSAALPDAREIDEAIAILRPYYLGQSLIRSGYLSAGVEQLQQLLEHGIDEGRPNATLRMLFRDMALVVRQGAAMYGQIGDALCRLGRYDEALSLYSSLSERPGAEFDPIADRRAYAMLCLGREVSAQRIVLDILRKPGVPADRELELMVYVADQSKDRPSFVRVVRAYYQKEGRPQGLALALHRLESSDQGRNVLRDHLAARPQDMAIFEVLARDLESHDPKALCDLVTEQIDARPEAAEAYTVRLSLGGDAGAAFVRQLDDLPASRRDGAAAWYLRGIVYAKAGQWQQARQAFDQSVERHPDFLVARLALVDLYLRRGEAPRALELLDGLEGANATAVGRKRAEALVVAGRHEEALKVVDQLLTESPRDVAVLMLKARVLQGQRHEDQAEQILLNALGFESTNEAVYAALFALYETDLNTHGQRWIELQKQAQGQIPSSRIARLKTAELFNARRQNDPAERLLRDLLDEDLSDEIAVAAMRRLVLEVLGPRGQWEAAESLLLSVIKRRPDDRTPIDLLAPVARELGKPDIFYDRLEAYLKRQSPSYAMSIQLFELYRAREMEPQSIAALEDAAKRLALEDGVEQHVRVSVSFMSVERYDQALAAIDVAIERFPEDRAELMYRKSNVFSIQDKLDQAEQLLVQVLKEDPEHVVANNDLAYFWADQNRNLEQALAMTRKAVAARPQQGAYLDSLGWVLYKMGDFRESVRRLEEARTKPDGQHPVILDHLGDAQWRLGNAEEAKRHWAKALEDARQLERPGAEVERLLELLPKKVEALEASQRPGVAPLPGEKKEP